MTEMKRTIFYDRHKDMGAKIVEFGAYFCSVTAYNCNVTEYDCNVTEYDCNVKANDCNIQYEIKHSAMHCIICKTKLRSKPCDTCHASSHVAAVVVISELWWELIQSVDCLS